MLANFVESFPQSKLEKEADTESTLVTVAVKWLYYFHLNYSNLHAKPPLK